MRIVIVMEGGLISNIFTDTPEDKPQPEILVCDYEMEGGMGKELMESPAGDMGYHRSFEPENQNGLVEAWFARWQKHEPDQEEEERDNG